jgi:hypothetical protein
MKKYSAILLACFMIASFSCKSPNSPGSSTIAYTLKYNGNGNTGGSIPVDNSAYQQGATVTVSGNPGSLVKSGYSSFSWNTAIDGSGFFYAPSATFTMGDVDVILYAIWMRPPTVTSISPASSATGVAINDAITATFSAAMNVATISASTFTVSGGVTGTVVYDVASKTATFAPASSLAVNTLYTATVTTGVKDISGEAMAANYTWSFTTAPAGTGPAPVNLGTAGNYVVLAKTEITNVPGSAITGNLGLSPAAESFITGFSQTDATGYATSAQVTGFLYAASMAPPTSSNLTKAISDMQTAYTAAAGSAAGTGANLNLGAGTLSSSTPQLLAGTYTWGTGLDISGNITLSGGANDTWIFQIAGNLTVGNGVHIVLSGGAQPKNIVWQLSGEATLGTTSQFQGIILSQTAINLETGATLNGRALAQSGVTLQSNDIVRP